MKKYLSLLLSVVLVLSLLAGCGSKTETPSAPANNTPAEPAAPAAPAAPPAEAKFKEDIIIGISGKIVALDPQDNSNTQHNYYYHHQQ